MAMQGIFIKQGGLGNLHKQWVFICLRLNTCCLAIFLYRLHYIHNLNTKYPNTNTGIFPSNFYCRFSVVKTQSSIEFQSSVFHPFHFNNSNFIVIVKILFLIGYSLERRRIYFTSKKDIFPVLSTLKVHFPAIQQFSNHKIFIAFHGPPWERFE